MLKKLVLLCSSVLLVCFPVWQDTPHREKPQHQQVPLSQWSITPDTLLVPIFRGPPPLTQNQPQRPHVHLATEGCSGEVLEKHFFYLMSVKSGISTSQLYDVTRDEKKCLVCLWEHRKEGRNGERMATTKPPICCIISGTGLCHLL